MAKALLAGTAYTNLAIPIRYNDRIVNPYSKGVLDGLDPNSWAKQAAPISTDVWEDVSPANGDGLFTGVPVMPYFRGIAIAVTAGGAGYTSAPTVVIAAPPAGGVQAVATAVLTGDAVTGITVTNPGSGYTPGAPPAVSFTGGGGGAGAAAAATVTNGGFNFDGTQQQRILLPKTWMPATTSRGYLAVWWEKIPDTGVGNKRSGGWHFNLSGSWGLLSNAVLRQHSFMVDGVSRNYTFPAAGIYQVAMGRCEDGVGGFLRRCYVNGAVWNSEASGANAAQPSTPPVRCSFGYDTGANIAAVLQMSIYRAAFFDVGTEVGVATPAWMDAIVAKDYLYNSVAKRGWA